MTKTAADKEKAVKKKVAKKKKSAKKTTAKKKAVAKKKTAKKAAAPTKSVAAASPKATTKEAAARDKQEDLGKAPGAEQRPATKASSRRLDMGLVAALLIATVLIGYMGYSTFTDKDINELLTGSDTGALPDFTQPSDQSEDLPSDTNTTVATPAPEVSSGIQELPSATGGVESVSLETDDWFADRYQGLPGDLQPPGETRPQAPLADSMSPKISSEVPKAPATNQQLAPVSMMRPPPPMYPPMYPQAEPYWMPPPPAPSYWMPPPPPGW